MAPLTYAEAVASLERAVRFGIHPSLDGIRALTEELGRPQDAVRCIQVTGTNGKTSVARTSAAILAAHGLRTAAYTSPHLVGYTERIEVDGSPVDEGDFARAVEATLAAAGRLGGDHTEFELLTAAALWLVRDLGVEWAVLEVGMGGRWDATSVVTPEVSAITGVGLDHTERLGMTVEEIASDKAYVMRPGRPVVLGPGTAGVDGILAQRADATGSDVVRVRQAGEHQAAGDVSYRITARPDRPGGSTRLSVDGRFGAYGELEVRGPSYQAPNVAVAVAVVEAALDGPLDAVTLRTALGAATYPGRFEPLASDPPLVIDGAHNPQAAAVLAGAIDEAWGPGRAPLCVLGVLADKDASGIISALASHVSAFVVTEPGSPRALRADELASRVESITGVRPPVDPDPVSAVDRARREAGDAGVLVTGSLYLVGEVRASD